MAISMLKIRRPLGRLIFNMGIAIPGKTVFLIETAPCFLTVGGVTPGRHDRDLYNGILSFIQINALHLKIGYSKMYPISYAIYLENVWFTLLGNNIYLLTNMTLYVGGLANML